MARKKQTEVSEKFNQIDPQYENEILETYSVLTESDPDFYLKLLPKLFRKLKIPKCFTNDIARCVDYFYEIQGHVINSDPSKRETLLQMITAFTITSQVESDEDIIDIVDIDKLMKHTNKLLKYRDNLDHIKQSWELFINASSTKPPRDPLEFKLTLPALQEVKSYLNIDSNPKQKLSDGFLIEMLSCCSVDDSGTLNSFELERNHQGLFVGIKDFACILGTLGEFD